MPLPAPFDNPPEIGPEFNLIVWAFNELSKERDPATIDGKRITVHRITHKAIREWAEYKGCASDPDLLDELITLVRAMDTVWVEVEAKQIKAQLGKKHGKPA